MTVSPAFFRVREPLPICRWGLCTHQSHTTRVHQSRRPRWRSSAVRHSGLCRRRGGQLASFASRCIFKQRAVWMAVPSKRYSRSICPKLPWHSVKMAKVRTVRRFGCASGRDASSSSIAASHQTFAIATPGSTSSLVPGCRCSSCGRGGRWLALMYRPAACSVRSR